jgi:hypothetical protein
MILKGILYVLLIIFSGAFLIICMVMSAVKFTSNSKLALKWLGGLVVSLIVLVFAIFTLVKGVAGKAKEFGKDMVEMAEKKAAEMDSLNTAYTNSKDSILESRSVAYLISLEPDSIKGRVPQQFYSYLGFKDYYRLPLRWPYSLHCMDSLGDGTLYDESAVQQFDVNDNGERSCDLHGIMTFAFNKNHLIGKQVKFQNKPKTVYFAFDLNTGKDKTFKNFEDLMNYAKKKGFDTSTELKSCKDYYNEF